MSTVLIGGFDMGFGRVYQTTRLTRLLHTPIWLEKKWMKSPWHARCLWLSLLLERRGNATWNRSQELLRIRKTYIEMLIRSNQSYRPTLYVYIELEQYRATARIESRSSCSSLVKSTIYKAHNCFIIRNAHLPQDFCFSAWINWREREGKRSQQITRNQAMMMILSRLIWIDKWIWIKGFVKMNLELRAVSIKSVGFERSRIDQIPSGDFLFSGWWNE